MSNEQPNFNIGWLTASADLSAIQFYGVAVSGDGTVATFGSAGDPVFGILQNKPESGDVADVMISGVSKLLVGAGDLAANDSWQLDADGKGITAASGDYSGGKVLIGAAAGEYATVTVGHVGGQIN